MNTRLPSLFRLILPTLTWKINTDKKEVFLTFDDGPDPEVTTKVLDVLDKFNAKATFFCVGENVARYPEVYQHILDKGHMTGNHTFNHLNSWKTTTKKYFDNIEQCSEMVNSSLFRPPYGKIRFSQISYLKMRYRIIMWTVLTEDYRKNVGKETCLKKAVNYSKPGSIVVFHDSKNAAENMLYALPRFLEKYSGLGYSFPTLGVVIGNS